MAGVLVIAYEKFQLSGISGKVMGSIGTFCNLLPVTFPKMPLFSENRGSRGPNNTLPHTASAKCGNPASLVFLPPSSFHPLSLSRFLFLFLFHLWPLNLLRFRAFFHQQPTSPMTRCLYLMQQLLCCPTVTCIWYSNLLASLWNILCLQLCQFVFCYDEFLTTCLHLFYNPSSVFDTLRFAFVFIQAPSWVVV